MSVSPRLFSLLLSLALAAASHGTAFAQSRQSKLDRVLRDASRAQVNTVRVIVQVKPGTRPDVKRALQAHGDAIQADYPGLDGFSVTVHGSDLATLEANPSVVAVSVDANVTSFGKDNPSARKRGEPTGNPPSNGSNLLWSTLGIESTLFRGNGVNVAILDSGIAPLRDLAPNLAGFWDFTRGGIPTAAFDDYGHGTHVAGLIGSTGTESNQQFAGVAPSVRLYGLRVLDKNGRGRASHVVAALEWIAANKRSTAPGAVKIDVVNLSLGHPIYEPAESDPLVRALENVVSTGVMVVVAAGNKGQDEDGNTGYAGITSPGNAPSALTVGAVDTRNTADHGDDRVAYFSARGPTWFDGFAKPDLVAPGVGLTSDASEGSSLYTTYPQLMLDGKFRKFARLSGTSMAAATATGVAALAIEANRWTNWGRTLTPNTLKAVLEYTALPVVDGAGAFYEPLAQGAGQVNGRGAIALAFAINTRRPLGSFWLRSEVSPFSTIDGDVLAWSRTLTWRDSIVRSDLISFHSELWDAGTVWGSGCDTDDMQCVVSVWGAAADADNIVWGTSLAWAQHIVWDNRVVGLFTDDDNIVWGTIQGLTEDNIVWGTYNEDDNIVWGTVARRDASGAPLWGFMSDDNIVWGTLRGDEIVWGTFGDDNIVWGTLRGDIIVWGTATGGQEGGRR